MKKILLIVIMILIGGILLLYYSYGNKIYLQSNFEYRTKDTYIIDLEKFDISRDNKKAKETTIGINNALKFAKEKGYEVAKLPKGNYLIDTSIKNPIELTDEENRSWTHNRQGIIMQSDLEFDITGAILQMESVEDPYYSILTISNCQNSKIIGGTIIGDRDTHNYGMRINNEGDMLESGGFDDSGNPVSNDSQVRTKDFIYIYEDWFTGKEEDLPSEFYIIPLWNTSKNTVDGGCRFIYCYDNNGKYLGMADGGNGFIKQAILKEGTSKIKIAFKDEQRLDATYAMTKREIYYTHEFGAGITIADSSNIEINGTTIKDCIGDSITTIAPPLSVTVDNLKIIDCTLENSRRQGISFVATGENYLVKDCNIGKINGTDPQSGIDFEHYDYIRDVVIDGCNFYDNKKLDIINYNGQDIEIKNSSFNGSIGSTFGWNMDIHDNIFKSKNGGSPLNLNTDKTDEIGAYFKIYNNTFEGYSGYGTTSLLKESIFKNNVVKNCSNFVISCSNIDNEFYNSQIQYSNISLIQNSKYENSMVDVGSDGNSTKVEKCDFIDTDLHGRGNTTVENCNFDMNTKPMIDGWKAENTNIIYKNCNINSDYKKEIPLLGESLNANLVFEDCKFNISRYNLGLNYGSLVFNKSDFIINENNNSKNSIVFNKSGYGYEKCPWVFKDCSFKSTELVEIYGGKVIRPIISDNIKIIK